MKFFLLVILLILSTELFAQDSIPHFSELSKKVFQCLCNKDYGCIESRMVSLKELTQLMKPMLKNFANKEDSIIEIDTNLTALNSTLYGARNIDSVYARAKQLEINWNRVTFIGMSDSAANEYMLKEYGTAVAQCTIKFSEGKNIYGIEYGLRFIRRQWKIEELHPYIVVYKKDGSIEGVMRQDGYDTYMDGYNHPAQKYIKKK
jgi:hypothetical protein